MWYPKLDTNEANLNQPHGPEPSIDAAGGLNIDAQQVDHLLSVKSFAEDLDLAETVNRLMPTQMGGKPGLIILGLIGRLVCGGLEREYLPGFEGKLLLWRPVGDLTSGGV